MGKSPTKLAIIIPTIGRPTLEDTLLSIRRQLRGDQHSVHIVADGEEATKKAYPYFKAIDFDYHFFFHSPWREPARDWGHSPSNWIIDHLMGFDYWTHIARMDDDDIYTPNAISTMQRFGTIYPHIPLIFQMLLGNDHVLWRTKDQMGMGNYGTPCFLIPRNNPMPHWGNRYIGDADYIQEANDLICKPIWIDRIVADIRPHER